MRSVIIVLVIPLCFHRNMINENTICDNIKIINSINTFLLDISNVIQAEYIKIYNITKDKKKYIKILSCFEFLFRRICINNPNTMKEKRIEIVFRIFRLNIYFPVLFISCINVGITSHTFISIFEDIPSTGISLYFIFSVFIEVDKSFFVPTMTVGI